MTDTRQLRRMSIAEFRAFGYLQEVNRLLLHPLGLALEVVVAGDGTEFLGGVGFAAMTTRASTTTATRSTS
jgi:hypothetical protein